MISDRLRGTAVRATTNIAPTQTLTDRPVTSETQLPENCEQKPSNWVIATIFRGKRNAIPIELRQISRADWRTSARA
jgi:hypothetical protein